MSALVVILGSLTVPFAVLGGLSPGSDVPEAGASSALGVLLFYVVACFITLFFNTALMGAAMIRMDGGNPHLGDGLRIARQRVGRIFGYACIAGTVGLGFVFGLAYVVLTIAAVFGLMLAAQAGRPMLVSLVILLGLVAFFTLAALQATLQAVYSAALYRYATDHTTPLPGFGPALLESAFAPKP